MFTGIVADRGEVVKVERAERDSRLWIRSPVLNDHAIGASVAVDGVCLTVADRNGDVCCFDVSAESLSRSTLGRMQPGDLVNLEPALRAGDELGGHMVQGHVDGMGTVSTIEAEGEGRRVRVAVPAALTRYIVEKGSVTVDGVSLTATKVDGAGFEVALVPHTLAATTLGTAEVGRGVNVEVDVLAKYVEKLASPK
jgi:riboflavin synthase